MANDIITMLEQHVIIEILKQPGKHLKPGDPLITSGIIDSFHLVDLALYVEDTFGVRIDDSELNSETFDTLEQLAGIIQERQS
jgi:acyl carrier protein